MRRPLLLLLLAASCAAPADGGQGQRAARRPESSSGGLSPFASAKAQALLADRLPCLGCHQLDGRGGTVGPDLTTVSARRSRSEVEQMIRDPQRMVPGTAMPRVAMPDEWIVLLADHLSGVRADTSVRRPSPPPAADLPPLGVPAAQAYARFCAACHGDQGNGDGPNAPNLPVRPARHADARAMSMRPDDSLYDAIAGGGWIMGKSARMPPFGATLAPDDIRALVRYIRELCACEGPEWSRDGASGRPAP